ncbi:MAG: glutaminyl-peptide cyclotransferase [Chloroflexi bacterium]|nr:glutaminyl-peptide cyclotransferase [Chloroflexota bacterium]
MPQHSKRLYLIMLVLLGLFSTVAAQTSTPTPAPAEATAEVTAETTPEATAESTAEVAVVELLQPEVIATTPHDTGAWTEGLLLVDDFLYESVGENGKSDIRKVDPATGEIVQQFKMKDEDYAEGLALVGDRFIQLTWEQEIAYIYDRETFEQVGTFTYEGEGWGLAYDGEYLWMSNGSGTLYKRDPETFEVVEEVPVTLHGLPIEGVVAGGRSLGEINELEVVGDEIYANIWPITFALRINKHTGEVTGIIDGSQLLTADAPVDPAARNYFNGIAYKADTDTFLVTGKYWPYVFEVTWNVIGELPPIQ